MPKLAIIGEHNPKAPSHVATDAAIKHANQTLGLRVQADWVSTEAITPELLASYQGVWMAPGGPYKNLEKGLRVIRWAREKGVPCLGTCGGFQHIILEYARNVLGYKDAAHAEYAPDASQLFIAPLTCSLAGREMLLTFKPDSKVAAIYGALTATENYYCNFGVNPEFSALFEQGPLRPTGADAEGDMRVVELVGHPFFMGTLFVPQMRSTEESPHPIIMAFLKCMQAHGPLLDSRQ